MAVLSNRTGSDYNELFAKFRCEQTEKKEMQSEKNLTVLYNNSHYQVVQDAVVFSCNDTSPVISCCDMAVGIMCLFISAPIN